jgi:hypothetical protein
LAEHRLTEMADSLQENQSGVTKVSRSSRRSSRITSTSSKVSARAKEQIRLAEMLVEKSLLKKKKELQAAEQELKLDTEIAKAQARDECTR